MRNKFDIISSFLFINNQMIAHLHAKEKCLRLSHISNDFANRVIGNQLYLKSQQICNLIKMINRKKRH